MAPLEKINLQLLVALLLLSLPPMSHGLEVHQKFVSPHLTNNFALDALEKKVYLAAVNRIFQLHSNLSKELEEETGPVQDNPLCHAPQLPQASCEHPKTLTNNYNKILQLDQGQRVVVVCGSIYQGFCQLRKMGNISAAAVDFPPQSSGQVTVFPSMLNIAANNPNASTVGLVLKGPGEDTRLLVGATYTGFGSPFFPKNLSMEDHRLENTPEIAIRSLNMHDLSKLFTFDINPSDDNIFKIKQEAKGKNKLSFVRAFPHSTYIYLAMNSDSTLGDKDSQASSLLGRICQERSPPAEPKKLTESYIQLGLRCGTGPEPYQRLLSVFPTPQLLFGLFEKGGRQVALCAFLFEKIEQQIHDARSHCFTEPSSGKVTVLNSVVQGTGSACEQKKITLQEEHLNCGAAYLQHPLAIMEPLVAEPLYQYPGLTSVAVANVNNYTVVFLGTVSGRLIKINLDHSLTLVSRKTISVAPGQPVHHIMEFDPWDSSFLFVMTSYQISRVKVASCHQYATCAECLGAADAHCGWCTMEARCCVQQDCLHSSEPLYWTSASEGMNNCPNMTIMPSKINIDSENNGILIQINGNFPVLREMRMSCDYGNGVQLEAQIASLDSRLAYCPLLPRDKFPAFLSHQDHVSIPVALQVNGTNVVWASFIIYDCKRRGDANSKTACTSCLTAQWECHWCVQKHVCVSNVSECQSSLTLASSEICPQIIPTSLTPAPTAVSLDITISLANVAPLQGNNLECDFGVDRTYDARWVNSSAVKCSGVLLHTSERSHHFPVNLQYKENPGHFLDSPKRMTVEVYNCAAGSLDCSQCLGRVDLGHRCIWTDSSSTCKLNTDSQQIPDTCPAPEIRKIEPLQGPVEGGTLLTIRGRNLGRRVSDVIGAVSIGGVKCALLEGRYVVSEEIVCQTGRALDVFSDVVLVNVSKEGTSSEKFSYVLPQVYSLFPHFGPKAGGTKVTITGMNLNIGSDLRVLVNDTQQCFDLVRQASTIKCTMPAVTFTSEAVHVCVQLDRQSCIGNNLTFSYRKNPVIYSITPTSSLVSGGRIITLKGEGFDMIQNVSMVVHRIGKEQTNCAVLSPAMISCPSPAVYNSPLGTKSALVDFYINDIVYMDPRPDPEDLLPAEEPMHSSMFSLDYHPDPQFFTANKEKSIKHHPGEPLTLPIHKEPDMLGLKLEEYQIKIGLISCEMNFIVVDKVIHCTVNESLSTSERTLPVTIQVGKYNQTITMLHLAGGETAIIAPTVTCSILLLLSVVGLFVFCTKSRRAERYWQKTLLQMEEMESQIREEIRKGFAELQTDMTDLTKELNRSQGIPFLEYKHFVTRTFFPKCSSLNEEKYVLPSQHFNFQVGCPAPETHPLLLGDWNIPENCRCNMEEGIALFSTLLSNKHFLITFVHTLEHQKDFAIRDRCNLASLLTIALHGKLEYYTGIMKDLLVDLIDASASKNPKLMLRRTESVVEKMLTNWMSICMYSDLRETIGEPFFLLLCAIKQQINKGSIDAITGKARYTLNEEWLLRENIEAKPMNLNVSFQGCGMDSLSIRVMDTDTVCQVKEKILEAFCKNLPYSQWPKAEEVDLEWFASSTDSYILRDLDNTSIVEYGRKKLNTLAHYKIPEGASLAMSLKDQKDGTLGRVKDLDTEKYFHLVLPTDELAETRKSHRQNHRKKVLPEIYLTRLLSTKGTLQKFLDDLFTAILSIHQEKPPLAIKYFFDFLEEQAEKRGISDPDTLHIWKTNSLPLRFWVNILKNPQFVFDIDKTDHMDACLSVIAQVFIDACSISDLHLGKDSPTNKLLYAKEIPEYRKIVQRYYKQIQEMMPLSEQEMNAHLAEESRKYRNEFNTNVALAEIYKYAKKYRTPIVNALEGNATTRRTQLQHKLEQVIAFMEDNIFECCSEA
ncbi:plexin-D1 [Microcaecilia unicolor]|uniref:Plexin-D1 n=1 Tax=Microcaecilia unicolor TaxID=1415580 RepID=A0A6P7YGB5_9AMPH|nr:plexin-D1 [Microcaecilia unicolor]